MARETVGGLDPVEPLWAMPKGGALVLEGWYSGPGEPVLRCAAGRSRPLWFEGPHPDHPGQGFRCVLRVPSLSAGTHTVVLEMPGGRDQVIGEVVVENPPGEIDKLAGPPPTMAVVMATYKPDLELLRRQVESIRNQTHQDWVCFLQDDASGEEIQREIFRIVDQDPRFRLQRNETNLGFYQNFEACLRRIPEGIHYVAFADQDDLWYPEKLSSLQEELDMGVQLTYSDCRIVDREGGVLHETFWTRKRNQWTDFERMILHNTVTGASAAFRRSLLDDALPFPVFPGEKLYHDHWLAVVALGKGPLAYHDKPLYDYVQHAGADTGHYDAGPGKAPEEKEPRYERTVATVARERTRTCLVLETLRARGCLRGPRVREAERLLAADRSALTQLVWLVGKSLRSGRPAGIGWHHLVRRTWTGLLGALKGSGS